MFKKSWFHASLLVCFVTAVALLMFLDYFDIDSSDKRKTFLLPYTWTKFLEKGDKYSKDVLYLQTALFEDRK